jgi:hypothetical protein
VNWGPKHIHLNLKNNNHVFQNLDGEKTKNSENEIIMGKNNFNTSYDEDPYAYDWYNSEFEDFDWRRRWTG